MLKDLLTQEIKQRGISQREAARQIGVSHTTLVAVLKHDRPLEVDTAYLMCNWLGVPITVAVNENTEMDRKMAMIAKVLERAPELDKVFTLAAAETEKGNLSAEDFKDIIEFTAFKMQQRKDHLAHEDNGVAETDRPNSN